MLVGNYFINIVITEKDLFVQLNIIFQLNKLFIHLGLLLTGFCKIEMVTAAKLLNSLHTETGRIHFVPLNTRTVVVSTVSPKLH